jgi:hypothetical protein
MGSAFGFLLGCFGLDHVPTLLEHAVLNPHNVDDSNGGTVRVGVVTDNSRSATHTESSKGKEIRIPGPEHPITISPAVGKIRVAVTGRIIAESKRALRLEKKGYPPVYYLPRNEISQQVWSKKRPRRLPRRVTRDRQLRREILLDSIPCPP